MSSQKNREQLLENPHDRHARPVGLSVFVQRFFVAVFVLLLTFAVVMISLDHWRRGTFALGISLIYLGVIRILVDSPRLRFLTVRSKRFDVVFCFFLGALIVFFATSIDALGS